MYVCVYVSIYTYTNSTHMCVSYKYILVQMFVYMYRHIGIETEYGLKYNIIWKTKNIHKFGDSVLGACCTQALLGWGGPSRGPCMNSPIRVMDLAQGFTAFLAFVDGKAKQVSVDHAIL